MSLTPSEPACAGHVAGANCVELELKVTQEDCSDNETDAPAETEGTTSPDVFTPDVTTFSPPKRSGLKVKSMQVSELLKAYGEGTCTVRDLDSRKFTTVQCCTTDSTDPARDY